MKKYIVTLLLLVAMAFVVTGCGQDSATTAEKNSWEKVQEKGEFVLGLDDSFPPMGFKDDKGEIVGFDIDLAKEVFSRLDIELKLQPISWDAKEQELNTGNIDAIWNGLTITEDRKKNILFSKPYLNNRQVLVVMKDSDFSTLADLEGKKLGLQAGSSAVDALAAKEDFKSTLTNVIEFDDYTTALMDLQKGGIDALLMDEIVADYRITTDDKGYKVLDESLASEEYGIGFRIADKELMEKVQETLDAMAADGKLAEISTKWFSKDITTVK